MKDCNCDYDFLCESCADKQDEYIAQMEWEYRRYCIRDENGNLTDVRDLN